MENALSRSMLLYGVDKIEMLQNKHVAVFGLGGVGGYVCEALVRMGVGHFTLIDHDVISLSNLNRQIIATYDTIGRKKIEVMKERMLSIQPHCDITLLDMFVLNTNIDEIDFHTFDYVVDALDTVTAKIAIIQKAKEAGVKVISSMGTGNKKDPSMLRITDIAKTNTCPLAKVMRRELRKREIQHVKVLFSIEEVSPLHEEEMGIVQGRKKAPGSSSFVPPSAGLLIASEVIKDFMEEN